MKLEEIHRSVANRVTVDTFVKVFDALGDAYSIDPRLIRPEDSLKKLLDADSWVLDAGTEKMNRWLTSVGIESVSRQPSTVLDLLLLVEQKLQNAEREKQS